MTGPVVTSINDGNRTCGLEELSAYVYTDDENVTAYHYELYVKGATSGDPVFSGNVAVEQPVRITGLNLTEGEEYVVRVMAGDAAGNWGELGESDGVLATLANDSVCEADKSPLNIDVVTNASCTNVQVELHYEDEVGSRSIKYGTERTSTLCSATEIYNGQNVLFENTGWICYDTEDNAGNNGSGIKQVVFKDEDGDGISDKCDQCPGTGGGKVVNSEGCASGQTSKLLGTGDMDGDGLPDSWEDMYNAEDCQFDGQKEDSDGDGISDHDEDYDGDGFTSYEEYLAHTNPCFANDAPVFGDDQQDDLLQQQQDYGMLPDEEPDIVAWTLLIIGLLLVFGGTGYLIYYYYYSPAAKSQGKPGVTPTKSLYKPVTQQGPRREVSPADQAMLQRRRERQAKAKARKRKGIFGMFSKDSTELPHVDAALRGKTGHVPRLKALAQKYVKA